MMIVYFITSNVLYSSIRTGEWKLIDEPMPDIIQHAIFFSRQILVVNEEMSRSMARPSQKLPYIM